MLIYISLKKIIYRYCFYSLLFWILIGCKITWMRSFFFNFWFDFMLLLSISLPRLTTWCNNKNTRYRPNFVLLSGQRVRHWPNINTTLYQRLVLAGQCFNFLFAVLYYPGNTNICITFVQRRPIVFNVGPALYKCYKNDLCQLGMVLDYLYRDRGCIWIKVWAKYIRLIYLICGRLRAIPGPILLLLASAVHEVEQGRHGCSDPWGTIHA